MIGSLPIEGIRFLLVGLLSAPLGLHAAELAVAQFKDREVVRHSVVLLRGTVEDGATTLTTRTRHRAAPAPVAGGGVVRNQAFKALVELGPGELPPPRPDGEKRGSRELYS